MKTLLLLLCGRACVGDLVRQIDYLKIENQILRRKLPGRVPLSAAERRRLIRFGLPLGRVLHDLISIVSPRARKAGLKANIRGTRPLCQAAMPSHGASAVRACPSSFKSSLPPQIQQLK